MENGNIVRNFKGIVDSTLREGLQFSRADFDLRRQLRIFRFLERIGIELVEVGNPVRESTAGAIRALAARRTRPATRIVAHIRNREQDLSAALAAGVDGANILCTADRERLAAMSCLPDAYLRRLQDNVRASLQAGLIVRVSVEDFFSRPCGLSREIYALASAAGAHRIGVADTLGRSLGWDVRRRIRCLRRAYPIDMEVHFHNDFGHAVSNALAALEAGANWVSASLAGIGERTGITPLSTLLVNLHGLEGGLTRRYDLALLTRAEAYVMGACGMEVPPHLMTCRSNGFAHKAGIHLDALIRFGPRTYEPVPPGLIGNIRRMILHTPVSGKTTEADVAAFDRKYGGSGAGR